jgi:competence protein ComEC
MWAARQIGRWPGSTLHLHAFAPWAIVFLALAVVSAVIWRSFVFRATAIPLLLIGLCGAASGPTFDLAVPATGDAVALRGGDGDLIVIGHRPSLFAAEQWLRADADGRKPRAAIDPTACDKIGCVGILADGQAVALVTDQAAFAEDCRRAQVIVTPHFAPIGCAAPLVIDRDRLAETGSITLRMVDGYWQITTARSEDEDRPWSRPPKRRWHTPASATGTPAGTDGGEPGDAPDAPLD